MHASIYNPFLVAGLTKKHSPGRPPAQTQDPSTDHTPSDSTNSKKSAPSPDVVQSAESSILHPHDSDLAKRRLSPQKSLEMSEIDQEDITREDNSGKLTQQLSALGMLRGATYVNVHGEDRMDEHEQTSAFRPLPGNHDLPAWRSDGGQRRSRASESEHSFHGNEETDLKKRISVASSHASEHSHHSYNKLTGSLSLKVGDLIPYEKLDLIKMFLVIS